MNTVYLDDRRSLIYSVRNATSVELKRPFIPDLYTKTDYVDTGHFCLLAIEYQANQPGITHHASGVRMRSRVHNISVDYELLMRSTSFIAFDVKGAGAARPNISRLRFPPRNI